MRFSTRLELGVMGYQATTVTPANRAPRAQAALPSMMHQALGLVVADDPEAVLGGKVRLGPVEARLGGGLVELDGLLLALELLGDGLSGPPPCRCRACCAATPT